MLIFECRELGTGCDYIAQGDTLEEVKKDAMAHTQTVHKYWYLIKSPQQKADINKTLISITHSP